jgi:hypothetical protein
VLEQQPQDSYVLALASHGYGPFTEGAELLPEVLKRLSLRRQHFYPVAKTPSKLPAFVRRPVRRRLSPNLRTRRMLVTGESTYDELLLRSTRATVVPNNRCGAIRINLRGREPYGSVEPGDEARSLVEEIRTALHELRDPVSGEPIVVRTMTPDELFGPEHHLDLPDVMVLFRDDLGPVEACHSPRVGLVEQPIFPRERRSDGWPVNLKRTGDHAPQSSLWIRGPGVAGNGAMGDGRAIDVAPTVLDLLGVPVPSTMDGCSLLTLASHSEV